MFATSAFLSAERKYSPESTDSANQVKQILNKTSEIWVHIESSLKKHESSNTSYFSNTVFIISKSEFENEIKNIELKPKPPCRCGRHIKIEFKSYANGKKNNLIAYVTNHDFNVEGYSKFITPEFIQSLIAKYGPLGQNLNK
jgi:hypothetical protein